MKRSLLALCSLSLGCTAVGGPSDSAGGTFGPTSGGVSSGGGSSGQGSEGDPPGTGSDGDGSGGDASGGDVSGGDASGGDASSGDASGGDASGGDASGGDPSGDDSGGEDSGPGVRFDVGEGSGGESAGSGGESGTKGCEKIDFLFVIDNSQSMGAHQQNLLGSFGPFMDTIAAEVDGVDYHIMVVDSDACPINGACTPMGCEDTLGAGQVRDCAVPAVRYLDSSMDLADIKDGFACAANVGDRGSHDELPMSAMVAAIGPESAPNGCNPGFLRDDAILVVTFITDDHNGFAGVDDVRNVGSPTQWYDAVMDAKGGQPENVVVLGLVALLSDQSCIIYGPQQADRFVEFVDMFGGQGLLGSVCDPDYNGFFQEAVGLIDTTCEDYVPPG